MLDIQCVPMVQSNHSSFYHESVPFIFQALHFSPAVYKHVVSDLKKQLILILNKVGGD